MGYKIYQTKQKHTNRKWWWMIWNDKSKEKLFRILVERLGLAQTKDFPSQSTNHWMEKWFEFYGWVRMLKYQIQNNNNKPLENTFTLKGKAVKMFVSTQ